MITEIRHTGLVVANLDRALAFWRDLLGFRVVREMDEKGDHLDAFLGLKDVRVTTVKLAAPDGNLIELLKFHSHGDRDEWKGSPHSTGFTHVAFTVDDLTHDYERLSAAGVAFIAPPQLSPDGSVRVTYCRGPEGVLLELVENLKS
ncbi:MAG: VOC family protein [Gemmatimonadaceae bacterium]|nr:VOC family protein [Gemmatimonadaceae bacterium]MBA3655777.1 VOC family protein [Gemmatimonadaceae bacterium]